MRPELIVSQKHWVNKTNGRLYVVSNYAINKNGGDKEGEIQIIYCDQEDRKSLYVRLHSDFLEKFTPANNVVFE